MINKITRFAIVVCFAFFACVEMASSVDLSVGIASNCARYGFQDRITLRVEIKNNGTSPVTLYSKLGWGGLGGLTLKIAQMGGEGVQSKSLDDDMISPSTLSNHAYYVTVFRNQFIGISREERVSELFPSPGQYRVWVEYLSPVPAASSLVKSSFWSTEMGKVGSNVLVLRVGKVSTCKRNHA